MWIFDCIIYSVCTNLEFLQKQEIMSKSLSIRFKKLQQKNSGCFPIDLSITVRDKVYKLTSARSMKNGFVNFFGETLQLPYFTKQFTIKLRNAINQNLLAEFFVTKHMVLQFSKKVNVFTLQKNNFKLIFEAVLIQESSLAQNYMRSSLSQTSLSDLQFNNLQVPTRPKQINNRNDDTITREKKKKKKNSMKLRISDTASQPQKHKQLTQNFIKGNYSPLPTRNLIQKQSGSHEYLWDQEEEYIIGQPPQSQEQDKKHTLKNINKKIKSMEFSKNAEPNDIQFVPYINVHLSNDLHCGTVKKPLRSEEKKAKNKKNRSLAIRNFSLKFLLTTGIIGGLSGWAGAKFQ